MLLHIHTWTYFSAQNIEMLLLVSPCLEAEVLQCIRPLAAIDTPNGALPVTLRDSNLQQDTKDRPVATPCITESHELVQLNHC